MELIERYLYEVGRRLPPKTRDDILAELRSVLQDKLDERVPEGQVTRAHVVEVLKSMGSPKKVATSFAGERYLIGPSLYPTMMRVMKIGLWAMLIIPAIGMWSIITSDLASGSAAFEAAVGVIGEYIETVVNFIGIVVLIFALLEWQDVRIPEQEEKWDPEKLPAINQPGRVSYFDMGFELAFNFVAFAFISYFFQRGGLPIFHGGETPGGIVPISAELLIGLLVVTVLQIALHFFVMHRGAWQVWTRLTDALFDLGGLFYAFGIVQQFVIQLPGFVPDLRQFNIPDWPIATVFSIIALAVMANHGYNIYRQLNPKPFNPTPVKPTPARG
jgi:hypothetical protein